MITINGGTTSQREYAFSMASFVCNKFGINPDIEINTEKESIEVSVEKIIHFIKPKLNLKNE